MESRDLNNKRLLKVTAFPLRKLEVEGRDVLWLCGQTQCLNRKHRGRTLASEGVGAERASLQVRTACQDKGLLSGSGRVKREWLALTGTLGVLQNELQRDKKVTVFKGACVYLGQA